MVSLPPPSRGAIPVDGNSVARERRASENAKTAYAIIACSQVGFRIDETEDDKIAVY